MHNGLIDKRPAAIASCHGVADVVDAVRLARTLGLEVAVRGGGHNVAGRAAIDQGLMIDLSPMKGIHVDAACAHSARPGRRSVEGAQPRDTAARARDDRRRRREHGDRGSDARRRNRLADAEVRPRARQPARPPTVVMADGRVLRASADENPDLFWAIRGGGGNFGIAASLEYTLHQVGPMITGGVVVHPLRAGARRAALLPRYLRVTARRGDAGRCAADRAGWFERQGGRHRRAATADRSSKARRRSDPSRRSVRR